jgi:hypothetical protein
MAPAARSTRRRRGALAALGSVALVALAGCGSGASPQSENYGNILASPEGLVLVESEHPTGWTRPDCFACHNVNNIHQVNRTGLPNDEVDLKGVRAIVNHQGEASCAQCHGDNGVEQ